MESKQTAVEWLVEEYAKAFKLPVNAVMQETIQQALEMEKEQINQACYDGYYSEQMMDTREYYNNTYGKHSQKKL